RPRRGTPDDAGRRDLADDPPLPEPAAAPARVARLGASAVPRLVARRAGARPRGLRPRDALRLDLRLLHARAPRGGARRGADGRALLHLLRGAGPVPG